MTDEKVDEETYSLIFSSLKHPIRRKILRMLENRELSFSEILETLAIDSGHLSYHLENLGDLITHTQDGKYRLSSFGTAAVRLMGGVEEYRPPTTSTSKSNTGTYAKIFSIVLAVILLTVSLYSMSLITSTQREVASRSNIPFALAQNQTFSYHLNFTRAERFESQTSADGINIATPDFASAINEWDEYSLRLDLVTNQTCTLNITLRDSTGKVISWALWSGEYTIESNYSGGIGAIITRPDSYRLEVQNINPDGLNASIGVHAQVQYFQRPLFYYGLAGLIASSSYLVMFFASWGWTRARNILLHRRTAANSAAL
jgi:DNA-binding transcriptional ArsR family regulator